MINAAPVPLDPAITDIVLPSAGILISAAIAMTVIQIQLAAARRDRKSDAVARVAAAISHIIAEANRKRRGDEVDFEPSFSAFDAAVTQLRIAVPRRDRITVGVLRDRLWVTYLNEPPAFIESTGWAVRNDLELWAMGQIPNREFRKLAAWGAHSELRSRIPHQAWTELARRAKKDSLTPPADIEALERQRDRGLRTRWHRAQERIFRWRYRR